MARRKVFVSPLGDPTVSEGVASVLDAVFPDPRTQAAIKMLGAQYQGQLLGNEQTGLENTALSRSNSAYESLGDVISDPGLVTVMRAGGGNADQLAGARGKFQEQGFRQSAYDQAMAGNQQGATNALFGVANGPVALNDIKDGYQLNPYEAGGAVTPTGQTLAEIVTQGAQARNYDASASAASALASLRQDHQANPQRYQSGGEGGKPLDISPADAKALDDMVIARIPKGAQYNEGDVAAVVSRASQIYQQTRNAGAAVDQAFNELLEVNPEKTTGDDDWIPFNESTSPANVVRKLGSGPAGLFSAPEIATNSPQDTAAQTIAQIEADAGRKLTAAERAQVASGNFKIPVAPTAAAANSAKPPRARNPKTGEVVELRNGQWVKVQ